MADVGVTLSIQQPLDHGEKLEFKVQPCIAGPFVLPTDYEAVSPVYLIQPSTAGEIHTDVTVCIHHCASLKSEEDCRNMKFLSASPTSQEEGSSTYTFTEMNGVAEKFKEGNQIGEVTVNKFGLFAVAIRENKGLNLTLSFNAIIINKLHGHLGDCLCALKLLPTMIEETEVQAVFYSCLSHPVYEKV